MVKALLAAGASRTAHDNTSFSCLHFAAQNGHLACVTLLIGRPENQKMSAAEIDARDSKGRTPLFMAARCGHRYCCAAPLPAQIQLQQPSMGARRWMLLWSTTLATRS